MDCSFCTLPDCAFDSPGCVLKQAARLARHASRRKQEASEAVRRGYAEYHRMWKIEQRARLSEARQEQKA